MVREEYNLPLTKEAYEHLIVKADGTVISKTRYRIPIGNDLTAELDIFDGALNGVLLVKLKFKAICESFCRCVLGKSKFKAVCGTFCE